MEEKNVQTHFCYFFSRESKISSGEKMKIGGGEDIAWLQISEPTEKDKGNYTFEIFGDKESYKRTLDLSGQGILYTYMATFHRLSRINRQLSEEWQ